MKVYEEHVTTASEDDDYSDDTVRKTQVHKFHNVLKF